MDREMNWIITNTIYNEFGSILNDPRFDLDVSEVGRSLEILFSGAQNRWEKVREYTLNFIYLYLSSSISRDFFRYVSRREVMEGIDKGGDILYFIELYKSKVKSSQLEVRKE